MRRLISEVVDHPEQARQILNLYNLENGGLDISRLNKKVPQYISYRLGQIKEDIIDGNIRVGMEIPVWAKHQNQ